MIEFLRRLRLTQGAGWLLLLATLLANFLALAPPFFVMQVLNRFLAGGVTATLIALVAGTAIAVIFEFMLRQARFGLARAHIAAQDYAMTQGVGRILALVRPPLLWSSGWTRRAEPIDAITRVQAAYSPANLCAVLDMPFSVLFVVIVALLNPQIGLIAAGGVLALLLLTLLIGRSGQTDQYIAARRVKDHAGALSRVLGSHGTARAFLSVGDLTRRWRDLAAHQIQLSSLSSTRMTTQQSVSALLQGVMGMALIGVGALYTLDGSLDVGTLIAINILGTRALMPVSRFAVCLDAVFAAKPFLRQIRELRALAVDAAGRKPLVGAITGIQIREATHSPRFGAAPLYRDVSATLRPGSLTVILDGDGSRGRALLETVCGLEEARQGSVLVNGVNLAQLPYDWWRLQAGYLPANPQFVDGSIAENFTSIRNGSEEEMLTALDRAGLRGAVEQHPDGLNLELDRDGERLTPQMRWRLGLARLFYLNPPVLLVEDPLMLPREASDLLEKTLRNWLREGRFVLLSTRRRPVAEAADQMIELPENDVARVVLQRMPVASGADQAAAAQTAVFRQDPSVNPDGGPVRPGDEAARRDGAIDADQHRQFVKARRSAQAITLVTCLLVSTGIGWASVAEVTRLSRAPGEVVPMDQVQTVESLEGGVVTEIVAKEGAEVSRGDPIVVLNSVGADADLGEMGVRMAALTFDRIRLNALLDGLETLVLPDRMAKDYPDLAANTVAAFEATRARHNRDLAAKSATVARQRGAIAEGETRIRNIDRQIGIVAEQVTISENLLARDLTNRMLHLEILRDLGALEAERAAAEAALVTARSALDEALQALELVRADFRKEAREALNTALGDFGALERRLEKLVDSQERRILRAPMAGSVKALSTVSAGSVIGPGEVVAEIVPFADRMIVEAQLATPEVGFVHSGMPVMLRLAGPDAMRYLPIEGRVERVSPDTFQTEDGLPYYKLTISTEASKFERDGEVYSLVPGLKVESAVVLGERTVLEYILGPVFKQIADAMRER